MYADEEKWFLEIFVLHDLVQEKRKEKKNPPAFFSLEVFEDITLPFSDVSEYFMILV